MVSSQALADASNLIDTSLVTSLQITKATENKYCMMAPHIKVHGKTTCSLVRAHSSLKTADFLKDTGLMES